jgi:hypothetical protein
VNAPHNGSYSIDIKEPDFRGLEPDFRLNYDSSQGIANNAAHQNWLGLGWSLSGFSVIERASPGRGTPFYSDTLDTYVLDGLEMAACTTSMVSPGCSAGGTHAMRAENYQRIVRNTSANSWTVTGRDGTQYLYKPVSNWQSYNGSSTTESKLATQYRWLLATITDRHGNQVGYSYWCDGVQHCYPDEVSYNGTAIKFYREARPAEDQFDYATGVNLARVNYRIKSIAVRTGGSLVRAYALSHEQSASTFMSRLKSVKEFGNDAMVDAAGVVSGGTSLPATQMSYSEQTRGFDVVDTGVTDSGPSSSDWNSTGTSENASQSVRLVADFNGDGRTDLGYGSSSYSYSRIDTTNDSFHNYECSTGLALYLSTGAGLNPASSTGVSGANTESGCSDYPSLGTTLGDFDGDGATNVIVNDKFFTIHPSTGILSSASYAIPGGAIGDFNGDGKADFLTRSSSSRFIYLSTGTSFTKSASVTFGSSSQKTKIGDFNGDGRDDIVDGIYSKSGSETRTLRLSTGTAVVNQPSIRTSLASDTGSGEVADVNGDGRADINMSIGMITCTIFARTAARWNRLHLTTMETRTGEQAPGI